MNVQNMRNSKGNAIPNQFIIKNEGTVYFQSYESVIAKKVDTQIYLDSNYWDYSTTTGRYRNIFLGESKKETEKKIKSGEYKLVNLNK